MSETPVTESVKRSGGLLKRRVFGIPVLYLAIVLVGVLALYAWKTREAPDSNAEYAEGDDEYGTEPVAGNDLRQLYPLSPTGTVYAQPPTAVEENAEYFGNNEWLQKAVAGMVAKGKNPGEVQNALQAYLEGEDISYAQGLLRDQAIKDYGLPPESFRAGVSGSKPVKPSPAPVKPVTKPTPAPTPKPAPKPAPPKTKTYTVKKGDTLWDISAKFYNGNSMKWRDIANRNNIRNTKTLQIGRVLVIP